MKATFQGHSYKWLISYNKLAFLGPSLVVQWLGLYGLKQGVWIQSLVGGTRYHMPNEVFACYNL